MTQTTVSTLRSKVRGARVIHAPYAPGMMNHFAFTGVAWFLMTANEDRPGEVKAELFRFTPSANGASLGGHYAEPPQPVLNRAQPQLPVVEDAPYFGERTFGSAWYVTAVFEDSDGSLMVTRQKTGNYSMYSNAKREGSRTERVPAWFVQAARTALSGRPVLIRMPNDSGVAPAPAVRGIQYASPSPSQGQPFVADPFFACRKVIRESYTAAPIRRRRRLRSPLQ